MGAATEESQLRAQEWPEDTPRVDSTHHLLSNVRVCHHALELVKVELAIAVLIRLHHRCRSNEVRKGLNAGKHDEHTLVHNLLQLLVLLRERRSNISDRAEGKEWSSARLTFRLFPTIIFSTRNSSPFEMKPSRSMSYTLNATVGSKRDEVSCRSLSESTSVTTTYI